MNICITHVNWDSLYFSSKFPSFAPPSSEEVAKVIIFVCGPPLLYNVFCGPREDKVLSGMLSDIGYDASQVVKF
jgi:hypothetical protein